MNRYKLVIFKDKKKEWRWHLVALNNKLVACSGEGYKRKKDCARIAARVFSSTTIIVD